MVLFGRWIPSLLLTALACSGLSLFPHSAMKDARHMDRGIRRHHFRLPITTLTATGKNAGTNSALDAGFSLAGRVAIVTGASRGIGKGIALELGREGAVVYVTGRSSRAGGMTTERALGPTLDENQIALSETAEAATTIDATVDATAEVIDAMDGPGRGIPVVCDAGDDQAVAALVERVAKEAGRLDCLVCSAFTTPPRLNGAAFRDKFWKQGAPMWDACNNVGLRGAFVASCAAAPLMIETAASGNSEVGHPRPLIVLISSFGGKSYTFNVAYGVGKAAIDRLAKDMAVQFKATFASDSGSRDRCGVDTVSLYPGVVKTEGNIEMDRRGEWREASGGLDLSLGESPAFSGRAVVELLQRPRIMEKRSGSVQVVAELAREFGFIDPDPAPREQSTSPLLSSSPSSSSSVTSAVAADGSSKTYRSTYNNPPSSIRSLKFLLPNFVFPQIEAQVRAARKRSSTHGASGGNEDQGEVIPAWIKENVPDILLPWSVFSGNPPPPPLDD